MSALSLDGKNRNPVIRSVDSLDKSKDFQVLRHVKELDQTLDDEIDNYEGKPNFAFKNVKSSIC